MNKTIKDTFIQNLNKYISLTAEETNKLKGITEIIEVSKKEKLLQQGDINRYDYFIVKGAVKLYFINDEGDEQIVFIGIENYWIGDLSGYYGHGSNFYIEAIEDCVLIQLSYKMLEELNKNSLKFSSLNRQLIINSYTAMTNRLVSLLNDTAIERFERLMKNEFHLISRIPHKVLASYIGISAEYFSKNLTKWNKRKS